MSLSNGENAFRVNVVGPALQTLKLLVQTSARAEEIVASVKQITAQLKRDPWNFFEQRYHLYQARLQIRVVAVSPVVVEYGVHMDQPEVFIRSFTVLAER